MVAPGQGGRSQGQGLTRWRTGLFACACALASRDAFADPYAQTFGMWFLAVAGGCVACVVVELAAGDARGFTRLAIGVAFAVLDAVLYLAFLGVLIRAAPFFIWILAAWVVPAARLWWLLRRRPAPPP